MHYAAFKIFIALIIVLIACSCDHPAELETTQAETEKDAISKEISGYIAPYVKANDFAGVVLVSHGDQVIYKRSFGLANLSDDVENQPDTLFEVGSISKTFTSAAILMLKDSGKLSLSDPIAKYWDGHPRGQDITIQNLLLYQAGIPDESVFPDYLEKREQSLSLSEYAEWIATQPLVYEPGTDGSYNNFSYLLLAHLVTKITNNDFDDYLSENILDPLSLNSTRINKAGPRPANKAVGYSPGPAPSVLRKHPSEEPAINTGSGNLLSTAIDLDRWLQAIENKELFDLFAEDYPYGWGVRKYFDRDAIEQTGIIAGFSSGILLFPDEALRIVFLSNIRTGRFFKNLHIDLAAIALGEDYENPELVKYSTAITDGSDYIGTYLFPGVSAIDISSKDNLLHFEWQKFALSTYLYPMTGDRFYNRMDDVIMEFGRDESGHVNALIWSPGENQIINAKQAE